MGTKKTSDSENPGRTAKRSAARARGSVTDQHALDPTGIAFNIGDLYRLFVESVEEYAIFALDPTGYVMTWNPGAERNKGYTAEEAIGKHFSIFYPPEDKAAGKPERELEIAARDGRVEDEGWRVRKDGSYFWANVIIAALRDENGKLVGFGKVTRDLTKQRAAEEQRLTDARRLASEETARVLAETENEELKNAIELLQEQSEELEQQTEVAQAANRAKGEFLAAMSHELRTPLNAIGGFTQLISLGVRGPVTEQQQEDLERIRRNQQHLLALINDILNFTRLEAGHIEYESQPVNLRELLSEVAHMMEIQTQAEGLEFKVLACPDDAIALADAAKTEQILLNLLSNAIKFTDRGSITLTCDVAEGVVRVRVADTGIGIAAEKFADIFEPFVQVGRTLTSQNEGTGLGLAISRDLARGMHGDLTVESELGKGSTFTLTLPHEPEFDRLLEETGLRP
jgi:PAS domain S-box-containing protein